MSYARVALPLLIVLFGAVPIAWSDDVPPSKTDPNKVFRADTAELAERVRAARRDYQTSLEQLRAHAIAVGDNESARQVEAELNQVRRIEYDNHIWDDPPSAPPKGIDLLVDADLLYSQALKLKDKGSKDDLRRAEELFQQLLSKYPTSDKVSETAYQLGDLYESEAFKKYDRAAKCFENCVEWNRSTRLNARLRAAKLYETKLNDREKARELYKEVCIREIDHKRVEEAQRRLTELGRK